MNIERIFLHENEDDVYFDMYCLEESMEYAMGKRPAVLVCPGGAYQCCSDREAEPIARIFSAYGYNCAVLRYSVGNKASLCMPKTSRPLLEASMTMSIMRQNAEKWNIDKDRIAVIGFSAGGHLAASLGTLWHDSIVYDNLDIEYGSNMPNAMILCYPVLLTDKYSHECTVRTLLGEYYQDEKLLEKFDMTKQVSDKTPKTFIWHTFEDQGVPVLNSLKFAESLYMAGVQTEMHILPQGGHGMSSARREVSFENGDRYVERWCDWCVRWLNKVFFNA